MKIKLADGKERFIQHTTQTSLWSADGKPISAEERVARAQLNIFKSLDNNQKEFLEFVLSKYVETGIEELGQEKLPDLLKIKYSAINDATELLGGVNRIRATFFDFQQHLFATA